MGCGCGKPAAAGRRTYRRVTGWLVTGPDGQQYGPYMNQMEARQTLTAIGGGTLAAVEADT